MMFWLIKQVFIALLSFSGSLATKYVFKERIKRDWAYNIVDNLPPRIYVSNKTKCKMNK